MVVDLRLEAVDGCLSVLDLAAEVAQIARLNGQLCPDVLDLPLLLPDLLGEPFQLSYVLLLPLPQLFDLFDELRLRLVLLGVVPFVWCWTALGSQTLVLGICVILGTVA